MTGYQIIFALMTVFAVWGVGFMFLLGYQTGEVYVTDVLFCLAWPVVLAYAIAIVVILAVASLVNFVIALPANAWRLFTHARDGG